MQYPRPYIRKSGASDRSARDQRIVTEFFTGRHTLEELAAHMGVSAKIVHCAISKHFKQLAKKRERDRSGEN